MKQMVARVELPQASGDAMRHCTFPFWLLTALASTLVVGCRTSAGHMHYPEDPLLARKAPIEGKADQAGPVLLAYAEPTMPQLPPALLAAGTPPPRTPFEDQIPSVPAIAASRERTPDGHSSGKGALQAIP